MAAAPAAVATVPVATPAFVTACPAQQMAPEAMEAIRTCRGQEFQRLELMGDSILEVVLHAHCVMSGPGCPYCAGRADTFTTDARLGELAREIDLGDRQKRLHEKYREKYRRSGQLDG